MNSRAKGKRGELELASYLREFGYAARRGQQFAGGEDSPDVIGVPGVHLECKRCEKGNPYQWLQQAIDDGGDNLPVVAHRRNQQGWIAILRLSDLIALLKTAAND